MKHKIECNGTLCLTRSHLCTLLLIDDLKGPPNDVTNVQNFLLKHCGFKQEDITVLRDDEHAGRMHKPSTKRNILDGFSKMVKQSKPKDVVFIQFSGHGGRYVTN